MSTFQFSESLLNDSVQNEIKRMIEAQVDEETMLNKALQLLYIERTQTEREDDEDYDENNTTNNNKNDELSINKSTYMNISDNSENRQESISPNSISPQGKENRPIISEFSDKEEIVRKGRVILGDITKEYIKNLQSEILNQESPLKTHDNFSPIKKGFCTQQSSQENFQKKFNQTSSDCENKKQNNSLQKIVNITFNDKENIYKTPPQKDSKSLQKNIKGNEGIVKGDEEKHNKNERRSSILNLQPCWKKN